MSSVSVWRGLLSGGSISLESRESKGDTVNEPNGRQLQRSRELQNLKSDRNANARKGRERGVGRE